MSLKLVKQLLPNNQLKNFYETVYNFTYFLAVNFLDQK